MLFSGRAAVFSNKELQTTDFLKEAIAIYRELKLSNIYSATCVIEYLFSQWYVKDARQYFVLLALKILREIKLWLQTAQLVDKICSHVDAQKTLKT